MKFKDIKVDDTVYVQETVSNSMFGRKHDFWIPKKVERVTAKHFIVGGARYKKDDGVMIGKHGVAYNLGDEWSYSNKVVDETQDMLSLKKNINTSNLIDDFIDKLGKVRYDHPELTKIYSILKQVDKYLGKI